jgi:hypothetical protein
MLGSKPKASLVMTPGCASSLPSPGQHLVWPALPLLPGSGQALCGFWQVGLDQQTVKLVCTNRRKQFLLDTADMALAE